MRKQKAARRRRLLDRKLATYSITVGAVLAGGGAAGAASIPVSFSVPVILNAGNPNTYLDLDADGLNDFYLEYNPGGSSITGLSHLSQTFGIDIYQNTLAVSAGGSALFVGPGTAIHGNVTTLFIFCGSGLCSQRIYNSFDVTPTNGPTTPYEGVSSALLNPGGTNVNGFLVGQFFNTFDGASEPLAPMMFFDLAAGPGGLTLSGGGWQTGADISTPAVPEPLSLGVLALGAAGLALWRRRTPAA